MSGFQPAQPDDASNLIRGLINTIAQTIKGIKTFLDMAYFSSGISMDGSEISTGGGPITGNPTFNDGLQSYDQAYMGGGINMDGATLDMVGGTILNPYFEEPNYGGRALLSPGGAYWIESSESVTPNIDLSGDTLTGNVTTGAKMKLPIDMLKNAYGGFWQVGICDIVNENNDWDQSVYAVASVPLSSGGARCLVQVFPYYNVYYGLVCLRVECRRLDTGALAAPAESSVDITIAKVA